MPVASHLNLKALLPAILIVCISSFASADVKPDVKTFGQQVKPLLQKYCVRCHGAKHSKAEIRFDNIDPDIITGLGVFRAVTSHTVLLE